MPIPKKPPYGLERRPNNPTAPGAGQVVPPQEAVPQEPPVEIPAHGLARDSSLSRNSAATQTRLQKLLEKTRRGPYIARPSSEFQLVLEQRKVKAEEIKLNGKVEVTLAATSSEAPDTARSEEKAWVECRHLAEGFAIAQKKKPLLEEKFSSRDGIKATFEGKLQQVDRRYNQSLRDAPPECKCLINSDNFGLYLQALAQTLKEAPTAPDGKQKANCLLTTADHAMALSMHRQMEGEREFFVVKVYDPNVTATYKRAVTEGSEPLTDLKFEAMLCEPELMAQYRQSEDQPLHMVATSLDKDLQPSMGLESPAVASPEAMCVALAYGALNEISAMLKSCDPLPVGEKAQASLALLLRAWNDRHRCPGFYLTLKDGHAASVEAFVKFTLASGLDEASQVELLAARRSDGLSGLSMALEKGHAAAVKAFTEPILASSLDLASQVELLAAKDSDGTPGLLMALQNGHADAVTAFIEPILASSLDLASKVELLAAKDSDGTPGFLIALYQGHAAAVKAFIEPILASSLDPASRVELLAAKRSNGMPGLFMALQKGHAAAVKAFIEPILASSLDLASQVELLAAKDPDGTPGFFMALQDGHAAAVKAFTEPVLASSLDLASQVELLAAKLSNGAPGFFMALQDGHAAAVRAYAQPILSSQALKDEDKTELLKPGFNGELAISIANPAALDAFKNAVHESFESDEQRARFLQLLGLDLVYTHRN
jgi:ShET2 enterotoxin, N-terminal region